MNIPLDMERKMSRWLAIHDGCYTFRDIMNKIHDGTMQSHAFGDTWVVTTVHEFPQRKAVHIDLVVGNLKEFLDGLPKLYDWARSIGATLMTGSGNPGWRHYPMPGWKFKGLMFSKDLTNV